MGFYLSTPTPGSIKPEEKRRYFRASEVKVLSQGLVVGLSVMRRGQTARAESGSLRRAGYGVGIE
jgi:hypothetical protein